MEGGGSVRLPCLQGGGTARPCKTPAARPPGGAAGAAGQVGGALADEGEQRQQGRLEGARAAGQAQEGSQLVQRKSGQRRPQRGAPALQRALHRQHHRDGGGRRAGRTQRRRLPRTRRGS